MLLRFRIRHSFRLAGIYRISSSLYNEHSFLRNLRILRDQGARLSTGGREKMSASLNLTEFIEYTDCSAAFGRDWLWHRSDNVLATAARPHGGTAFRAKKRYFSSALGLRPLLARQSRPIS